MTVVLMLLSFVLNVNAGDWSLHKGEIQGYRGSYDAHQKKIEELVKVKNQTSDKKKAKEVIDEIILNFEEMKKLNKKIKKLSHHIRYEHPGKGAEWNKKYRADGGDKSIEHFEKSTGIDKLMNDLKSNVDKQYKHKE